MSSTELPGMPLEGVFYSTWRIRTGQTGLFDFFTCAVGYGGQGFPYLRGSETNLHRRGLLPFAFTVTQIWVEILDAKLIDVWPFLVDARLAWHFLNRGYEIGGPISTMFGAENGPSVSRRAAFMDLCAMAYHAGGAHREARQRELEGLVQEALMSWDARSDEYHARLVQLLHTYDVDCGLPPRSPNPVGVFVYRHSPILIPPGAVFAVRLRAETAAPTDFRLRINLRGTGEQARPEG